MNYPVLEGLHSKWLLVVVAVDDAATEQRDRHGADVANGQNDVCSGKHFDDK
jgi:hypothetical protein